MNFYWTICWQKGIRPNKKKLISIHRQISTWPRSKTFPTSISSILDSIRRLGIFPRRGISLLVKGSGAGPSRKNTSIELSKRVFTKTAWLMITFIGIVWSGVNQTVPNCRATSFVNFRWPRNGKSTQRKVLKHPIGRAEHLEIRDYRMSIYVGITSRLSSKISLNVTPSSKRTWRWTRSSKTPIVSSTART